MSYQSFVGHCLSLRGEIRNKQKIKEEAKQLEIYEDHIRTVKEATKLNQELVKAKKEEISAEKNLLKVQEVLQERLLKDKRNGEKSHFAKSKK